MKENPFEKFDKPSDYLLPGEKEETHLYNISQRISEEKTTTNVFPLKWLVGIAAALLIAATVFLLQPTDLQQLAVNNFSAYKNYQEEVTRGGAQLSDAYSEYDKGNFAEAVAAFEQQGKIGGLDALYYTIALQGNGEWQKAHPMLSNIDQGIPVVHRDAYEWHLALGYLALGSKEEALRIFDQVISSGSSQYLEQAKLLSKKLK